MNELPIPDGDSGRIIGMIDQTYDSKADPINQARRQMDDANAYDVTGVNPAESVAEKLDLMVSNEILLSGRTPAEIWGYVCSHGMKRSQQIAVAAYKKHKQSRTPKKIDSDQQGQLDW